MIILKDIRPLPLMEGGYLEGSQVWNHELEFVEGKKYLVTAPSGTGKSTLLHIIYGLRHDYEGSAVLYGKAAAELKPDEWSELRQRSLSIVFQNLRLFPEQTARENIEVKRKLLPHINEERVQHMADHLGVANLLDKPAQTLSYGQRQRVAIIRALCQPFDYLLLDEPFSHLDEENIRKASELITQACEENQAGFILVSLGDSYFFQYDHQLIL